MRALQDRLPELQKQPPCIHVAGTNGKGSVSVMLAEIFQQAGYKVGLYTSPHLHDFGERIRINGKAATSEEIIVLTEAVRAVSMDLPITFFEATTAMALLAFHRQKVDIAIIETGLGGRLDATNIVESKLSLITPVSYDHSEHLGECLEGIAAEKAGIIKARTPVVVGKQVPEVVAVLRQVALSQNAEIIIADDDYSWAGSLQRFHVDMKSSKVENLRCNLAGAHQADNFAQAVVAALKMRSFGFAVNDHHIRSAGQNLSWPGRLEWWG
ncbi:MAG: bifunctional folylpolyglutamate synthase/dihydrofolate synthase, partial [Gammaproteobacteria bacterium]|nr:bifunctional folylpolyglutamate synthase/dihydrofolate synthase [Gammaproteobacteria bacterium]